MLTKNFLFFIFYYQIYLIYKLFQNFSHYLRIGVNKIGILHLNSIKNWSNYLKSSNGLKNYVKSENIENSE